MSLKITVLPDHVINQIAAGEVIEHPASAIKELVDNAIDAKASRIDVAVEGGGQLLIQVEDDGCGMNRADAEMSLLRHATSKIKAADDLQKLQTMGFRGEALAAIASISKLEIRTSDGTGAVKLFSEGGQAVQVQTCARNRGTTVVVQSLFYNAPARRKFQKSPQANCAQAAKMVQSLALSHPEIAFSFSSQGERLFEFGKNNWRGRIQEVLGAEFCEEGVWIEEPHLHGFLGNEAFAKKTRAAQHFFLNRRPIFSPIFARALKDGYGTRLIEGFHPAAVLFLEKDPEEFDVNVHPQKKEVRFCDEQGVFCELRRAVQRAFLPRDLPVFEPVSFEIPQKTSELPWEIPSKCSLAEPQDSFLPPMKGRALCVVGSFLLAERERKMILVELLQKDRDESSRERSIGQALIEPVIVSLEAGEESLMGALVERCCEVGIEAREFGKRQLCIEAIPKDLDLETLTEIIAVFKDDICHNVPSKLGLDLLSKAPALTLAEAERLWQMNNCKEIVLEEADLARIYRKKLSGIGHEKSN